MKKAILFLTAAIMSLAFFSCIDEDGAGVPMPKKLYVQNSAPGDTIKVDIVKGEECVLRWVDVKDATYAVTLTNEANDYTQAVSERPVAGALSTMSMTIPCATLVQYAQAATPEGATEPLDVVLVKVTATPADPNKPGGLNPNGSTETVTVQLVTPTPEP